MENLADVQSAIADVEREMKKLRNKIAYRERTVQALLGEIEPMKREEADLVDRYVRLVAEEQEIIRPESAEDT